MVRRGGWTRPADGSSLEQASERPVAGPCQEGGGVAVAGAAREGSDFGHVGGGGRRKGIAWASWSDQPRGHEHGGSATMQRRSSAGRVRENRTRGSTGGWGDRLAGRAPGP